MPRKRLKPLSSGKVTIFKIRNRRGYAAVCLHHLTEGRTPDQAFRRLAKTLKRSGYALAGHATRPR